ncbi:non-canonical purine NTP pyrophosphatase [Candidatus Woesearchaeota archaeon CG10_big_fil_rev_8_21_14_0_10_34_8]|nr:MAG: non-canonical purine NTP pyrophosphatase [Candidatus Woesearchaeota archaeon CG10_big_fil_rev_8_21_14_0_10_34_8]
MKLYLATTNPHKVMEVKMLLANFGIKVEKALDCTKIEPKEWTIEKVAKENAKRLADASGKPTIVDDSGCFFSAFKDFPGALSNWAYKQLGYDGFMKLLEGKNREAVFKCAAAVCFPGEEAKVFIGEMKGKITLQPESLDDKSFEPFPYERIFVIDGFDVPVCKISKEEKNKHSHRGNAFRKLGEYLQ